MRESVVLQKACGELLIHRSARSSRLTSGSERKSGRGSDGGMSATLTRYGIPTGCQTLPNGSVIPPQDFENRASHMPPSYMTTWPRVCTTACLTPGLVDFVIPWYLWQWSSAHTSKSSCSSLSYHLTSLSGPCSAE